MSQTHTVYYTVSYNDGSGAVQVSQGDEQTAGEAFLVSESIPDSSTNLEVTLSADVSAMQAFLMVSTQDLLVYTNDSGAGSPDQTFSLTANRAIVWSTNHWASNPITTDINANIYVTNASGSAATLTIKVLQDPTP